MKILHIVPSYKPAYTYGGTIESVALLCEGLEKAGVQVMVFTTTANGKEELDVQENSLYNVDGVEVIYFKRIFKDPIYISPALWKRLYRECENYDVVHIHSWWNILVMVAAMICKRKKTKFIISPHGMMSDYILQNSNRFFKRLSLFFIGKNLLKASVFHSTSVNEFAECKRLIPAWNGFVIPNIVWLPVLNISKPVNSNFTIIFLSRIHPKKGIELLIEAISRMQIKPLLRIAGTGEDKYMQQLKDKAKNLGIEENIEWAGWQNREEKFNALMRADLFALASYNENFANAVVEALYAGTPVLISDKIGVCDFVSKNKLGWICKPEVSDIMLKLQEAMRDTEARLRINKCGTEIVRNYFSEKKLVGAYYEQYKNM
jgi:glycosyltransferase involved in cell wall biosynthesis